MQAVELHVELLVSRPPLEAKVMMTSSRAFGRIPTENIQMEELSYFNVDISVKMSDHGGNKTP